MFLQKSKSLRLFFSQLHFVFFHFLGLTFLRVSRCEEAIFPIFSWESVFSDSRAPLSCLSIKSLEKSKYLIILILLSKSKKLDFPFIVFLSMAKISTKKFDQIFSYFIELYPNAQTELNFDNGFQLLVAVALSAQATDKQVNKVTASLFQKVKKPEDILQMGFENFEQSIKSIGLYKSKARNLRKTAQILAQGDGVIPDTQDELVKLP